MCRSTKLQQTAHTTLATLEEAFVALNVIEDIEPDAALKNDVSNLAYVSVKVTHRLTAGAATLGADGLGGRNGGGDNRERGDSEESLGEHG